MYTATGEGQKLLCDLHQVNWVWTFVLQKKMDTEILSLLCKLPRILPVISETVKY